MRRFPRLCLVVPASVLALTACGTTVPLSQQGSNGAAPTAPDLGGVQQPGGTLAPSGQPLTGGSTGGTPVSGGVTPGVPRPGSTSSTTGPDPGAVAGPQRAIPPTGPGWDAKNDYIGVTEASDQSQVYDNAGLQGVNPGNQETQARAVAAYWNANGGLWGRKVVIRMDDHRSTSLSSQPEVEAQATCQRFTQDERVVAVVNTQTGLDTPSLRACLAKARIPLFGVSISALDDTALAESHGLFIPTIVPSWTRFAPVFVSRLKALGWFTGWDTAGGAPGAAPVRIGIFAHDDVQTRRILALVHKQLAAAGHAPAVEYLHTDPTSESNSAVLQFRGSGVTHVILLDGGAHALVFGVSAESQGYRPRYGVWTGNGPGVAMELNTPKRQLVGALGVGTAPPMDVVKVAGELTPGGALCRKIMRDGGETYGGKRFAEAFAFSICDSVRLYVEAARAGGGLDGDAFLRGSRTVGPAFRPSMSFLSGVRNGYQVLPGAGRDLRFDTGCSCFRYDGPPRPF
jgi:hypothetical protein